MKTPKGLIVALDVPTIKEARELAQKLSGAVRYFKIGSELFTAEGPKVVEAVLEAGGEVFLDLKFHDIPNTVAAAVREAAKLGVFMMNVHALGGLKMMQEAREAIERARKRPYLVAVTVLTSMKEEDLLTIGIPKKPNEAVLGLAKLANDASLDGVVCSGEEARMIRRSLGKDFLIVTPGIRPAWAETGDQARVTTPAEAFQNGADYIVVGRPITRAKDPAEAARRVLSEI